jgi:hypothetical protein
MFIWNKVKAVADFEKKIRVRRIPMLQQLDVEFLKYLEKNNDVVKKNKIISDKDILRKLPESFDYTNINTPIELKSLWPINILGEYDL